MVRFFPVCLDGNLDRILEGLKSERHVNVCGGDLSLLRVGLPEHLEGAAPGVVPLPETPPMKAPPLRRWGPYNLQDGSWGSSYQGNAGKLPENLAGCSIEIMPRRGDAWTGTVFQVIDHRKDLVLVRDSGKG